MMSSCLWTFSVLSKRDLVLFWVDFFEGWGGWLIGIKLSESVRDYQFAHRCSPPGDPTINQLVLKLGASVRQKFHGGVLGQHLQSDC